MKNHIASVAILFLATIVSAADTTNLRCEYRENPLGIDVVKPRLSWMLETRNWKLETGNRSEGTRSVVQVAYQVLVASSEKLLKNDTGDLWDSGKVESDQSVHVEYKGQPLESRKMCYWKVRVWTLTSDLRPPTSSAWSKPAMWTMGLLKPDDWKAQWITAPPAPASNDEMDKMTVVKASYQTLDGRISVDVTEIMRKELVKKEPFEVHFNKLGGDPFS